MALQIDPDTGYPVGTGTTIAASNRASFRASLANHESRLDDLEDGIDDIIIGGTTPAAGTFTDLTVTGDLVVSDTVSGSLPITRTVSGSATTKTLNAAVTWNTSGSPTAIFLNVTNTSSGSSSKLADLQVDSTSKFSVSKAGNVIAAGTIEAGLPIKLPFYNITLPSAATYPYSLAYFGTASGNKKLVFSDGTDWRYPDGTVA